LISSCASQRKSLSFYKKIKNDNNQVLSGFSGLVNHNDSYFGIRDNSNFLYQFDQEMNLVRKTKVLDIDLPENPSLLKKVKPDFESLLIVSKKELLIIPSGSKQNRVIGALVKVSKDGFVEKVSVINFKKLYDALLNKVGKVNIEGAILKNNQIILIQRGNSTKSKNALIFLSNKLGFLAENILDIKYPVLPYENNYPYTFTDAIISNKGEIIFLAVVEQTENAIDDGAISGMMVGTMDFEGNILKKQKLALDIKFEGISYKINSNSDYLIISDSDDDTKASDVYQLREY
jgi:hypothetical protein